jgi:hypothetical protein
MGLSGLSALYSGLREATFSLFMFGRLPLNDGDFEARQAGENVGLLVWSKAKSYFNGKAIPKT